jgi:hypothetical protein
VADSTMHRLGTDIRKGAVTSYSRLCFPVRAAGVAGLGAIAQLGDRHAAISPNAVSGQSPSRRRPYWYPPAQTRRARPHVASADTSRAEGGEFPSARLVELTNGNL